MAIDYNRLMEELDSCLGLESSATKSVKRPSGPSKKRKAFEGYDDVDMEIIQAMKDSPEGAPSEFSEEDLVYSENDQGMPGVEDEEADKEESPEVKLADSIDCLFNDYVQSGKTPQEAADSIKDLVESAVAELYDPDDEEAEADEGMKGVVTPVREVSSHSLANRSARESSSGSKNNGKSPSPEEIKVIKYTKKAFGDLYNSGLYWGDGEEGSWEDLLGNEADKLNEYGLDDEENRAGYAKDKMLGVPFKTKDQVRTLSKNVDKAYDIVKKYGEGVFSSDSSATESLIGYDDPRFQTLEDIVVRKILKSPLDKEYKDELIEDIRTEGVEEFMGYLDEEANYIQDKVEAELKDKESMNRAADAYVKSLVDDYNESNGSATESNSKTVDDDPYDPDAAFEALSSKMLNRYSQLTHRNQLKSKKSAEEGVSATEVKIDDNAIRRVSCEFAYSGKNLRKMVAEAIKKGVI